MAINGNVQKVLNIFEQQKEERHRLMERLRAIHRRYEQLDAAEVTMWQESQPPIWWTHLLETVLNTDHYHQNAVLNMYIVLFEGVLKKIGITVPDHYDP